MSVVAVAMLSAWLGHEIVSYKRQRKIAELISSRGGVVEWRLYSIVAVSFDEQVNDATMVDIRAGLESLASLRQLDLAQTRVGDSGLKSLVNLSSLEELSLGDTQVTDQGTASITRLSSLRTLWLGGTCVTDRGLAILTASSSLRTLRLDQYSPGGSTIPVTKAGVASLKAHCPKLHVVVGSGWMPPSGVK